MTEPVLDLSRANKARDAWWTVLVVDPLLRPVLPLVVTRRSITPDAVTMTGGVFAIGAGAVFLAHLYTLGAVLFELHFFLDCLDGKLARLRNVQSARGAFLDLSVDLGGTAWCFAALGAATFGESSVAALALLASLLYVGYTWSTAQRRALRDLRSQDLSSSRVSGTEGFLARHRLNPLPFGVEIETVVLFVLPLFAERRTIEAGLVGAAVFFAVAGVRNVLLALHASGRQGAT